MYRFLYFVFYLSLKIVFPTKIIGKKNIDKKTNYLMLCNHRSTFDAVLLYNNIYKRKYYLAKKEMFKSKFKFWFWSTFGVIPIDRNGIDLSAIKSCVNVLKNNSLVIFPEGTRANDDSLSQFKNGGAMIAIKSNANILPIYIDRKPRPFRFTKVYIGNPFNLSEFANERLNKEILEQAGQKVVEKMKEVADIVK